MNRPVHNHGAEDGPGLACRESLIGDCLRQRYDNGIEDAYREGYCDGHNDQLPGVAPLGQDGAWRASSAYGEASVRTPEPQATGSTPAVMRWDLRHDDRMGSSMYPFENGGFVAFEAYAALASRYEKALALLQEALPYVEYARGPHPSSPGSVLLKTARDLVAAPPRNEPSVVPSLPGEGR